LIDPDVLVHVRVSVIDAGVVHVDDDGGAAGGDVPGLGHRDLREPGLLREQRVVGGNGEQRPAFETFHSAKVRFHSSLIVRVM